MKKLLLLFIATTLFFSCKKEEVNPENVKEFFSQSIKCDYSGYDLGSDNVDYIVYPGEETVYIVSVENGIATNLYKFIPKEIKKKTVTGELYNNSGFSTSLIQTVTFTKK